MLNPGELEIEVFCRGLRVGEGCDLIQDARFMSRTRAGLGSGLELVIPGDLKDIWMNAPTAEPFVRSSPFVLEKHDGVYRIRDERDGASYRIWLPDEPKWYKLNTRSGTPMHRIGVLQGTYLGIYVSGACRFWYGDEPENCRFCTTALNVGSAEEVRKSVDDVVDVCAKAKEESGITFVHFNTGFQLGHGIEKIAPYVKAVKEQVGLLVGVQCIPAPKDEHWKYDRIIDLGADHFSFCWEFHNPDYFARYCPGKQARVGQQTFFDALEYCQSKLPRGACSGEIIAGVEPVEDTIRAIDYITSVGAFPTICIFRPVEGSDMADHPSPEPEAMKPIMRYMYLACRKRRIPIGVAPNVEVSLIVNPDDARYLVRRDIAFRFHELKTRIVRRLAHRHFAAELKPHPVKGSLDSLAVPHSSTTTASD